LKDPESRIGRGSEIVKQITSQSLGFPYNSRSSPSSSESLPLSLALSLY